MVKQKKTKTITPEKQRESSLREISKQLPLIPEPTYKFNIGDSVDIGSLEDVIVNEVFHDGKIYEIDYTNFDYNFGRPIKNEHQRMFVIWLDIRKSNDSKESLVQNEDLRLSYSQRAMSDIFGKAYFFGIDFDPDYQRDYVWELQDKINLIDSIFNNVDIGKFVFINKGYDEDCLYEILDGKQRIRAILDFYEDRFQYKGKYFSDLSYRDQNHFERYAISSAEVKNITKDQILRYFLKLNRSGKVMSKEQLQKVESMLGERR